ncbi:MAG TPA: hypothetical protein PLJ27_02765 [Polyangiaceae bacterium]|nr:MAG: hypothetical protein BWY17_01252 [Deltaproteobacteria bacterium ADurb.Bin207]HOD24374.1 hypothetical protein [Polyangiaceae bacterium]HPB95113.1 hypothetical protein [Polyangiaceae bacterium]HPY17511.1 hypothetical protein [Polyangiaceae bacterium]HQF25005.1 hypothetical protein [Polyangiaceae bacterium]
MAATLDRSQRFRAESQIDLQPYTLLLNLQLKTARSHRKQLDATFFRSATRLIENIAEVMQPKTRPRSK